MGAEMSMMASACQAAGKSMQFEPASVKIEDAKELPMEDGIWVIAIVNDEDTDEIEAAEPGTMGALRIMTMIDENGLVVGANAKDGKETNSGEQAVDLLKQCLFAPMIWKPRRPRYIGFRNDVYFTELPLDEIGSQKISMFTGALGPDELPKELEQRRACTVCRTRGMPGLFETCTNCDTVFYCSKDCMLKDYKHKKDDHGHNMWCARMKQYTAMSEQMADLPFTFIKETTDPNFHDRKLKQFLAKHGVLNHGFWRWEYWEDDMPAFGELEPEEHPVALPAEGAILDTTPEEPSPVLENWTDYYKWRGFRSDSPVAALLQWPLTIYNILTHHATKQYPDIKAALQGEDVFKIHLVGVEKEADLVPLFWELGHLFPKTKFDIVMIGSMISQRVHGKEGEGHRVKVKLVRGLYHDYKGPKPNLVIGFNIGLAAYASWGNTLKKLQSENIPAYMTDYCQYSSVCAKSPMEGLKLGTVSSPVINSFRSPIRKYCEEQRMPWYSNGFIYRLEYI